MQPMDITPEILPTRAFKRKFTQCLERAPRKLFMVTPYFGETPWGRIVEFSRWILARECEFQLITRPPKEAENRVSRQEAEALARMGVDLRIHSQPPLHSKIYQFAFPQGDMAAFVGSANFSTGGFEKNDETVAFFQKKEDNKKVAAEIRRLASAGAFYYRFWRR